MPIELNTPKTSDGKIIFSPAQFRGDIQVYYPGSGDDIANGIRHMGAAFRLESTEIETVQLEFQFGEFVYFVGGMIRWAGAAFGDEAHYEVYAPATEGVSNPGAGAYAKLPIGGGVNMWVPAGTPGAGAPDWDLDLSEKLNANVRFTKVAPVPGTDGASFFDWDEATETVSLSVAGPVPKGSYHLFDSPIILACFLPNLSLLGDTHQEFVPSSVKAKKMLPHWIHRVKLKNSSAKTLQLVWCLYAARMNAGPGLLA